MNGWILMRNEKCRSPFLSKTERCNHHHHIGTFSNSWFGIEETTNAYFFAESFLTALTLACCSAYHLPDCPAPLVLVPRCLQIKLIEGELMQLTNLEVKRRNLDTENLQVGTQCLPLLSSLLFLLPPFGYSFPSRAQPLISTSPSPHDPHWTFHTKGSLMCSDAFAHVMISSGC